MHVLICGAGIAGQTLAWFLAKTGIRVTVIEKNDGLPVGGQNIDIEGSAISVMVKMGLLEEIRKFNSTERGMQFITPQGKPFAPFPVKPGNLSPTAEFEILRGDLAKILYDAIKEHQQVTYHFGTTIEQLVSNDHNAVIVQLSNGEHQTFDLLVAADGQWSTIRTQHFPPEAVEVVNFDMYAAYCTIPRTADDNDWWNVYLALESRLFFLRPDPHGTTRAMATYMPPDDARKTAWQQASRGSDKAQIELLQREFAGAGWQVQRMLDALDKASDFHFQAVQQIKMTTWSTERVVCVGDAAYSPTFLTGMGTSLAIIGAYVLAGELSKLKSNEHPSIALRAYENKLRAYVEAKQKLPPFVPGMAHPQTAWKRWLLHLGASFVSKVAVFSPLANKLSNTGDDGFVLPEYQSFSAV